MFRLTPVYGSRGSPQAEDPQCTLVEYAGCKVLWNVGWYPSSITNLTSLDDALADFPDLPDHDCLILSDSTMQSLGGLPLYYMAMQRKLRARLQKENDYDVVGQPDTQQSASHTIGAIKRESNESGDDAALTPVQLQIYATFPTVKMGQMTLYDHHASICLDGGRPPYSLADIDTAMGMVQSIKYSQSIPIAPSMSHPDDEIQRGLETKNKMENRPTLSITGHRAGHVVGAAFYVLQNLQDETIVVLTTSRYNIAKELHLDSSTLLQYGSTPEVLVTHPGGQPAFRYFKGLAHTKPPVLPSLLVTQAERNLMESIMSVLRRDGNALLPADASGRVLELLLLLNQQWERQHYAGTYNLIWYGPMVANTIEFTRSQLEWMSNHLEQEFNGSLNMVHPYKLKSIQFCTSMNQVNSVLEETGHNPTCVVATGLSLDHGPARDMLLAWADNPDNAIIFTDSSHCYLRQQVQQEQRRRRQLASHGTASESTTTPLAAPVLSSSSSAGYISNQLPVLTSSTSLSMTNPESQQQQQQNETETGGSILPGTAVTELSEWTTAAQLLMAWGQSKYKGQEEMEDSVMVDVFVPHRAPLAGQELTAFWQAEEAARRKEELEAEQRAMLREVELAKGRLRLGVEQDDAGTGTTATTASSSGNNSSSNTASSAGGTANAVSGRPKKKSRFDPALFLKFSKPLHLTFEFREEAVGLAQPDSVAKYGIGESVGRSGEVLEDDYGIAVLHDRFTDIVSGVDPSRFASGSGRLGDEVLKRGFGYGVDLRVGGSGKGSNSKSKSSRRTASGSSARVSEDDEENDEEAEEAMEAMDLSEGNGIIRGRNGRPPTKVTTIPRRIEVLAEVSFVPLEGCVDAKAARQSVRALQPRQVIVLGGPKNAGEEAPLTRQLEWTDEVTLLAEAARSFATGGHDRIPYTPIDGETIELSVGHAAYSVRLLDTPFRSTTAMEVDGPQELVELYETKIGACTVSALDYVATGQKVAADGSIVLAPKSRSSSQIQAGLPSSSALYLSDGEVLLTDLRSELIAQGMKADYRAHVGYSRLLVNGKILVKKDQATGRMDIEGPLCEDFYTVRSVVRGQYVTL